MAGILWPVNAADEAPMYDGRALRQTSVAIPLAGATAADPFGVVSGVRPGTSSASVTATSTRWSVAPLAGVMSLPLAGAYEFAFPTAESGDIAPAETGAARTDRLCVVASDPSESDGASAPGVVVEYVQGTPGGAVPALPGGALPLARIPVPPEGSGTPTVVWEAPELAVAGSTLRVATVSNLPAGGATTRYEVYGDTAAKNGTYVWSGTAWRQAATDGWVTFAAAFSGTSGATLPRARSRVTDGECTVDILLQLGSGGGTFADPQLTLPIQATWAGADALKGAATWIDVSAGASGRYAAAMYTLSASLVRFGIAGANGLVGAGAPFATAAGDQLHCYFSYPIT